ncbi:MAG: hypothetical protein V4499_02620 [Pseudomonadota bacterium]
MQARKCRRPSAKLIQLGIASADTLGLPIADVPEPMGFWRKTGISND